MIRRSLKWPGLLAAAFAFACAAGCSKSNTSYNAPTPPAIPTQQASQMNQIVKSTGGNWNKLTPAQQQYMIKTVGKGSPIAAQMDLLRASGQLNPAKGTHH